jgi:hypothetical protein
MYATPSPLQQQQQRPPSSTRFALIQFPVNKCFTSKQSKPNASPPPLPPQETAIVWFDLASAPLHRAPSPAALRRVVASCGRCLVAAAPAVFVRYEPQAARESSSSAEESAASSHCSESDELRLSCMSIVPSFFRRSWYVTPLPS